MSMKNSNDTIWDFFTCLIHSWLWHSSAYWQINMTAIRMITVNAVDGNSNLCRGCPRATVDSDSILRDRVDPINTRSGGQTVSIRVWHASPCHYARTRWRHPSSTYHSYTVKHTTLHDTSHKCMLWRVLMKGSESPSMCTVPISV